MTNKASVEDARELIEQETGPFHVVKHVPGGLNSELSVIIRTADESTFIKGRRADHPRAWTQERERAVNPAVRHISPSLTWSVRSETWDLNGFEHVPGRHADYSPGSADIPKIVTTLRMLQETPCPDTELKEAEQRWESYSDAPELFAGACLLHTEWTPGNVLVGDRAYLVDWAWPTRGAAWIDPACWIVWLVASGHTPASAENHAAMIPSWEQAPPRSVDEFALAQARMWAEIAAESSQPWTKSLAAASSLWSAHREKPTSSQGTLNDC